MVAVVAPTFDLGNTLARVAQIQGFRSQNRLAELQLTQAEQQAADRAQLAQITGAEGFDITDPNSINQLARLGQPGMAFAGQAMNLQAALAQLDASQLQQAVTRGQLVNNASRSILASSDPHQAAFLALKDPTLREMFPNVHPDAMNTDELLSQVAEAEQQSRIFNDPVALNQIVSGPAAEALGFQPHTTALIGRDPMGRLTEAKVLQEPSKELVRIEAQQHETPEMVTARKAAELRAQSSVDLSDTFRANAASARNNLRLTSRFKQLAPLTETGLFAPAENTVREIAREMGFQVDEVALAAGNNLIALSVPMTLETAQKTKGPISDKEMGLFAQANPALATSPLGNQFILQGMETIAQRDIDLNRLAAEWTRRNDFLLSNNKRKMELGGLTVEPGVSWDEFAFQWETANPLWDDAELEILINATSGIAPTSDVEDLGGGITLTPVTPGQR